MPLPQGIGFSPIGSGVAQVDYGQIEGISALQRNPQIRRASGVGPLNLTGSVFYGIWGTSGGAVTLSDQSGAFATLIPLPIVFDQGIPTANLPAGGTLSVVASNTSTNLLVLYK